MFTPETGTALIVLCGALAVCGVIRGWRNYKDFRKRSK